MDWNLVAYFFPYIIGVAVPLGVGIYSFRHRSVNGAVQYGWIAANRFVGNLAYIFEMLSATLDGKVFWRYIQLASLDIIPILFAAFVFEYTDYKPKNQRFIWSLLIFPPAAFLLLLLTNPLHGWVLYGLSIESNNPYSPLFHAVSPIMWALSIYGITVALILVGMLVGKFFQAQPLYRAQAFAIALGFFLGIIGIGITTAVNRQTGFFPLASIAVHLCVAWGLFRYRLFDLRPIARDVLFEKMSDLVIVLDAQDRIVDINPSALKEFNMTSSQVIGQPVNSVFFSEWNEFREPVEGSKEFYVKKGNKYFHFDIHATLLHDKHGEYQGRIFVARDITSYAALQWQLKELNDELKTLNADLEERVKQRTMELAEAYDTTLQGWARALELRDKETEGHSRRVTDLTLKLARALDVAESNLDDIRRGALLHDIGKMAIPDDILRKTDNLTREEREIVATHPVIAYQLLSPIKFLEKALEIPYCHHERWDGSGYPRGLKGEEIPLSARIFTVVDVWDAIQSNRVYRKAWTRSRACAYLREQSARYFDPEIVGVFLDLVTADKI